MSETDGGPRGHISSPDGQWWWDGGTWRPVRAAPPAGPGTGGGWLLVALIVVAVAVSVPLGVTEVVIASRIGHVGPPRRLPVSPPAMPYLADASETGVELAATSHGLRCGSPQGVAGFGHPPRIRECMRGSPTELLFVETIGRDDSHVSVVTAHVDDIQPGGDRAAALALLQAVVSAAVAGPDGAADSAWLSAHFDRQGTSQTTVDGVTLRLMVSGSQRTLIVAPASYPPSASGAQNLPARISAMNGSSPAFVPP